MNIRFSYLYRDFSNYKKFNEIVFLNPANKSLEEISKLIKDHYVTKDNPELFNTTVAKYFDEPFKGKELRQ